MGGEVIEGRVRLAREMKTLLDALGELGDVPGEGVLVIANHAQEQIRGAVLDQAYVACAAADDWAAAKGHLPGDEPPEWLHLYGMARIAPFTIRGIADDPDVFVLSDLYDLLRTALESTDRIAVEGLIDDAP